MISLPKKVRGPSKVKEHHDFILKANIKKLKLSKTNERGSIADIKPVTI